MARFNLFQDLHELLKAVHREEVAQFLVGVYEDKAAVALPHQLEKTEYFPDPGAVHKGYVLEVDHNLSHPPIEYRIQLALERRAVFERDLPLDSNDAPIVAGFDLDIHSLWMKILSYFQFTGKHLRDPGAMTSRFVVHRHSAGRPHFDLRLIQQEVMRSWSLLREPPSRAGEKRLAIERESFAAQDANSKVFREDAFGEGKVYTWDEGEVDISGNSVKQLDLVFRGTRLTGRYELRRMRWYPGNRWLLKRTSSG